jgi:hypothetical protein
MFPPQSRRKIGPVRNNTRYKPATTSIIYSNTALFSAVTGTWLRYLVNVALKITGSLLQVKEKIVLVRSIKECNVSGDISPLILNLRTKRR